MFLVIVWKTRACPHSASASGHTGLWYPIDETQLIRGTLSCDITCALLRSCVCSLGGESLSRDVVDWQADSEYQCLWWHLISKKKELLPTKSQGASVSQPYPLRASHLSAPDLHTPPFQGQVLCLNTSTQISLHRLLNLKGFIFQAIKHVTMI